MAKFIGNNIFVFVGSTAIGSATSKSLSLTQAVAEVSDSDSDYEAYLPSYRGGTIDFEGYVDFANDGVSTNPEGFVSLAELMLSGTYGDRTFTVVFGTQATTADGVYSASAILESLDMDAGDAKEGVTFSGTFRLTGVIALA